jgi:methylenetetrahydrofolate dehydrogenase (NADP+)/methenyltetrahydrofolate cyclohydrolase
MGKPFLVAPSALAATKFLALYNINPANRHVVIIGRDVVTTGPLASLLTKARATVTTCHPTTNHLVAHTRQAEILISGGGQPGLVKGDMVRPGAVVIDYGMNYSGKNQVVGDVDFEKVAEVAAAVTPVPAGIGPLTIVCLFENVLKAARFQLTAVATSPAPESVSKGKESYPDKQEVEVGANLLAARNDPVLSSAADIKGRNNYYN